MSRSLLLPEPLQQRLQAVLAAWVLGLLVLWSLAV